MDFKEINALGNAIDTTWGKSSTSEEKKTFTSCKVKMLGKPLEGDVQLLCSYTCVLNFGTVEERERHMKQASKEGESAIEACIAKIKKDYKEEIGKTLKVKVISSDDDWELLSLGAYSGRRDCFFHKKTIVEVK